VHECVRLVVTQSPGKLPGLFVYSPHPKSLSLRERDFQRISEPFSLRERDFQRISEPFSLRERDFQRISEPISLRERDFQRISEPLSLRERGRGEGFKKESRHVPIV
jgi:integrase